MNMKQVCDKGVVVVIYSQCSKGFTDVHVVLTDKSSVSTQKNNYTLTLSYFQVHLMKPIEFTSVVVTQHVDMYHVSYVHTLVKTVGFDTFGRI